MLKTQNIQFVKLVNDVFASTMHHFDFRIHEECTNLVIARKDDIELYFRLESTQLFYYFSLEIKLSGELGQKATSNPSYRHVGVTAIVKCINPNYKIVFKAAQTEDELMEMMEAQKQELLLCKDILLGDISIWQRMVDCLGNKKIE